MPKNSSKESYQLPSNATSWSLIPQNQLGLDQGQLPVQTLANGGSASGDINWQNGTWTNGGSVPTNSSEPWNVAFGRGLANRYFSSVFCSWYSTGGSIPGLLPQLSPAELNATNSDPTSEGHMYEKFSMIDIDAAGKGGEYTVQVSLGWFSNLAQLADFPHQAGFGWTNGAILWVAANYGKVLDTPACPAIDVNPTVTKRGLTYSGRRVKRGDGRYLVEATREINRW